MDTPSTDIRAVVLPDDALLDMEWQPDLLGGVTVLRGSGVVQNAPDTLYSSEDAAPDVLCSVLLTAIPYYAWANREAGSMRVWLPASKNGAG